MRFVVVAALLIVVSWGNSSAEPPKKEEPKKEEAKKEGPKPGSKEKPFRISDTELRSQFRTNPLKAKLDFKDQWVEVEGKITAIYSRMSDDSTHVWFGTAAAGQQKDSNLIVCVVPDANIKTVVDFWESKGKSRKIVGKCRGLNDQDRERLYLVDCKGVPLEKEEDK